MTESQRDRIRRDRQEQEDEQSAQLVARLRQQRQPVWGAWTRGKTWPLIAPSHTADTTHNTHARTAP